MKPRVGLGARGCRVGLVFAALGLLAGCAARPTPGVAPTPQPPATLTLAPQPGPPSHVVLVAVAGLSPEAYRGRAGSVPDMPGLARMASAGAFAERVLPVTPASTYPALTTLVTGEPPSRHGVAADRLLGDHGVRRQPYWHASQVRATTLWQAATEARRSVAALGWPATVGANIGLVLPEIAPTRPGETLPGLLAETATPWLAQLALAAGAGDPAAAAPGPLRDAMLVSVACEVVRSPSPPDLLLLRLGQAEPALRSQGPDAPAVREAFTRVDAELLRLVGCLAEAQRLERTAFVVAGDHGTLPVHTAIRANVALADSGLLERAERGGVAQWLALARSNGGSAFVYARDERDAVRARRVLEAEAAETGAFRVVGADEMLGLGADPEAWFGVEAQPGWVFLDDAVGPRVAAADQRGAGGYLPGTEGMAAGFVAWGRGVRAGVRIPIMRQTDVAPTVAALLGLDLGRVAGRALVGVLAPGPSVGAPGATRRSGVAD